MFIYLLNSFAIDQASFSIIVCYVDICFGPVRDRILFWAFRPDSSLLTMWGFFWSPLGRRLDQIRREMSEDSVSRMPEAELSLPSTPPPWTMEPPPSYDTVMKSQEPGEQP